MLRSFFGHQGQFNENIKVLQKIVGLCLIITITVLILDHQQSLTTKLKSNSKISINSTKKSMTFQAIVEQTYKKVSPCLTVSNSFKDPQVRYYNDLELHYKEILSITAQFRGLPPHPGSGNYSGMWIENLFIKSFIDKPFEYFNGLIPLFVQWSDYNIFHHYGDGKNEEEIFKPLANLLRKDVIYVAVSQANYGIQFLKKYHRNVIVMNAGGEGK